jgi:putative endonuclease
MSEHKQGLSKGFSKRYNLDKLIYFETYQYINEAIKRGKNMKKWKREWKVALINKGNIKWEDLSKDWFK